MINSYIHSQVLLSEAQHIPITSLNNYICYLNHHGYSQSTIPMYLKAIIHCSSYLKQQECSIIDITVHDKATFLGSHLPICQCPKVFSRCKNSIAAALSIWLKLLDKERATDRKLSTDENLVQEYDNYLKNVAGLSPATRVYRRRYAIEFITWFSSNKYQQQLGSLTSDDLFEYICHRATQISLASTSVVASSLRSFIRFLSTGGICQFIGQIYIPHPKLQFTLPPKKSLSSDELRRLFQAVDRETTSGKRDYAIIRCLADLGMRTNDVAKICLNDIDWRNKTIILNPGKSRRQHKLPLPKSLLWALVDYISSARPVTQSRHVFVYHRAPLGHSVKSSTIRGAVRRIFEKAGFKSAQSQVHRLRHTMATRLLMNNTPLKTISDVLGHQSINTTIRYTYINDNELKMIALPWPKESK